MPIRWSSQQLQDDAVTAREQFRVERVAEPLDLYNDFFAAFASLFRDLIGRLPTLAANPIDTEEIADLLSGKEKQKAFRYLAAPPISEDDLKAVADTTLAPTVLKLDADKAQRVRDTILGIIDPHRFPWMVAPSRQPTAEEHERAVIASAALAAAREVETRRRTTSKDTQEEAVKQTLRACGFKEVSSRDIPMLTAAPTKAEFCGESRLAGTRADVVVRLPSGRVMAIECKVSNSSVNSYKRVVHDTGGKASEWYRQLGKAQVIPCAVLSGVFNPSNLQHVQNSVDVYLFWQHRLSDLEAFVKSAGA